MVARGEGVYGEAAKELVAALSAVKPAASSIGGTGPNLVLAQDDIASGQCPWI